MPRSLLPGGERVLKRRLQACRLRGYLSEDGTEDEPPSKRGEEGRGASSLADPALVTATTAPPARATALATATTAPPVAAPVHTLVAPVLSAPARTLATALPMAAATVRTPASFVVPVRASPLEIGKALQLLLPGTSSVPVELCEPVQPTGVYGGHCSFVALLRSSSIRLPSKTELDAAYLLRALAVAVTTVRLMREPELAGLLAASLDGYACSSTSGALQAYLIGQLARTPSSDSQYAGAVELCGLACALGRRVIVLVEKSSGGRASDTGGAWGGQGDGEGGTATADAFAPLVMICTRRRHMIPVMALGGQPPLSISGIRDALSKARAALEMEVRKGNCPPFVSPVMTELKKMM